MTNEPMLATNIQIEYDVKSRVIVLRFVAQGFNLPALNIMMTPEQAQTLIQRLEMSLEAIKTGAN